MTKQITGYTGFDSKADKFFFRFQYTDELGKRKQVRRLFDSESKAKSEMRKSINKHEQTGERIHAGERMKFNELATLYEKSKVFAVEYKGNRKVAGLRSYQTVKIFLDVLKKHFGAKLISKIRPSDVEKFKLTRLNTKTKNDTERAIASVNRELAILRACLNFGMREGWLRENVFSKCSVISKADENIRSRILSRNEEIKLLNALEYRNKQNKQTIVHIKPLVIAAIDTGMRRGELFKLLWSDIDFESNLIFIRATNTKTQTARVVGISERLYSHLIELWNQSEKLFDKSVFGLDSEHSNINKAWKTACREAKIDDLHYHDLRHTFATRITEAGTPMGLAMKLTGHSQTSTFQRYNNTTDDAARSVAKLLDNFNSQV